MAAVLRSETVGGVLLVVAAVIAIGWANSPWAEGYVALRDARVGFEPWHLQLSIGAWASDGLLAVFFFLVGLELKREIVIGSLRDPRRALVPVVAAAGGVVLPALVYLAVVWPQHELRAGWAIPAATDIAFAVAVLALIGRHLPPPLRLFLLTLAVVDDLIAITIIAVFYTTTISLAPLVAALALVLVFGTVVQRRGAWIDRRPWAAWLVLVPIALAAWGFLHASGVHATITGVLLAATVPVRPGHRTMPAADARASVADGLEHRLRPFSAGVAVPVFAFFAAGVTISGADALDDPITLGVALGLVAGKPLGILIATRVVTWVTPATLDPRIRWVDLFGISLLAGIGFTVSLLIADLSFPAGTVHRDNAKLAILAASLIATALAASVLVARNRAAHRRSGSRTDGHVAS